MNTPQRILFMVDHMLLKLGRYLRVIGYNATWNTAMRTHELILRANIENRIFLTRNMRLADQYPKAKQVLAFTSMDTVMQLHHIVKDYDLDVKSFQFSRCIRCNVVLKEVKHQATIRHLVPSNIFIRHVSFFQCFLCNKVFWNGAHVRNLCWKMELNF